MTGRRVTRALHDDHMAVIALLRRLAAFLRERANEGPPETGDARAGGLLGELAAAIEDEIGAHFAFEDEALFPLLAAAGAGGIGEMLAEEHAAILPLARRVAELARAGRAEGFTDEGWAEFRRLGAALAEELTAHAEKEEAGLLPLLDDVLEADEDARLAEGYGR